MKEEDEDGICRWDFLSEVWSLPGMDTYMCLAQEGQWGLLLPDFHGTKWTNT